MENNSRKNEMMKDAKELLASLRIYKSEYKYEEALDCGLSGLKVLGMSLHVRPGTLIMLKEINRTKKLFTKKRIKKITSLKADLPKKTQLQLTILSELIEPAMKTDEDLFHVLLMRIAAISIKKGNSNIAAIGYAGAALIFVRYLEDDEKAKAIFSATMSLLKKMDDSGSSSIAKLILGVYVSHLYVSWLETLSILDEGVQDAFAGDEEVIGGLCLAYGIEIAFVSGIKLSVLQTRIDNALGLCSKYKCQQAQSVIDLYRGFIDCVAGENCGDYQTSEQLSPQILQVVLSYNLGKYEETISLIKRIKEAMSQCKAHYTACLLYEYEALALTAIAVIGPTKQSKAIKRRVSYLKSQLDDWVDKNPHNYGQTYQLIEASMAQLSGNFYKGEAAFEKAIELSEKNGDILDQAMAFVALARLCRQHEKEHMAIYYMMEGARSFEVWQGNAISHQLMVEEKIHLPHEDVQHRWQLAEGKDHVAVAGRVMALTEQLSAEGKGLLSDYCLTLSQAMDCDKVLAFVDDRGVLKVHGMTGVSHEPGTSCDSMNDVSVKVIKQVFRNNDAILVNSDKGHELANFDAYIMDHGTGCILSVPLAENGGVMGVLYAERLQDFSEEDCAVVKRFTKHVAYLWMKTMSVYNRTALPELTEDQRIVFEQVRHGKSIKEISELSKKPLNQVLEILNELYDILDVDNLYEMKIR